MVKYLMKGCITPAAEDSILKLRVMRCPVSLQLRAAIKGVCYLLSQMQFNGTTTPKITPFF